MSNQLMTTQEHDLTPAELALLQSLDLAPEGVENLQDGDIGMPARLRISSENKPIKINDQEVPRGNWVNMLTGQHWNGLEIVVLMYMKNSRVMWPVKYDSENAPMCKSNDGIMPDADAVGITDLQTGPCATCEMAKFSASGNAPRCTRQRNFLVWIVESKEPAILTLQSTALKAGKILTSLAQRSGLKRAVFMSTTKREGTSGNWFVPTFTQGETLGLREVLELAQAKEELKNLVIEADLGQELEPADAPQQASVPIEDEIPF